MIIQVKVPAFPLSIVIPVLNEERALPEVLAGLETQEDAPPFEVVLADGGSTDGTVARFEAWKGPRLAPGQAARLVVSPRAGRATQMNIGARTATGKALLFLHADTVLPPPAARAVTEALADPAVVGGGFRHAFRETGSLLRLISFWATTRSRLFGIHLGDQAIFVRRSAFEAFGGFPEVPLFEDLYLSRRLRAAGRVVTLPLAARTSARRLLSRGVLRTGMQFAWLRIRLGIGADLSRLRSSYPDVR